MEVNAKIIRDTRVSKGFSQEYLAEVLGISQSHYCNLEKGDTSFDITKLGKLLDVLELNPLDVLEFSEKQQIFINSSYSGNQNTNIIPIDTELFRKIIKEELQRSRE